MKTRYLFLAAVLVFLTLSSLEAQTKKRLAILPFSGGQDMEGETISILLSYQKTLLEAFTVQPRNSAIYQIMGEQQFQRWSGLINSDAISEIGKMNTTDLVVSGYIATLGSTKLLLISIIDVTEIQQIAGVYQTYQSIEEVPRLLPGLSRRLVEASKKEYRNLPGLAVPSFSVPPNVNANDAMVLAQILATEIVNLGRYAVFPRNNSIDDVLKEHQIQRSGLTAGAMALGTSQTIDYILSSNVSNLGRMNLFLSQILSIESGEMIVGTDREYQDISDGLSKNLMREIARELIRGVDGGAVSQRERNPEKDKAAKLWTVGASVGSSFAAPFVIGTVHGTIAPIRYTFLELGFDFGLLGGDPEGSYYSMYPFAHIAFFLPFPKIAGWYVGAGAGLMMVRYTFPDEMNYSDNIFATDIIAGVNILDMIDISYTLRTNFAGASNKVSVGYTYRFK